MIDDYTTVHTKCRPDTGKPSAAKSMCTIILKVFKNIQAVSSFNPLTFHNLEAIDVALYESHRHQNNGGIIAVAS